ncbi:hypothetical protein O7626_01155 [Micromonospora sp. WMMD1102]|uniref:hypothetical protein n=1 Tax=Micromonospora sp. WMMD1102 TaxID=3016105 RepID=UPI002414F850|nr:hypothetical protein [Micromonospora sp. WMMD1102]MDG4784554.1 hypothetical protein [Micromonospora sp. WMMD1102]
MTIRRWGAATLAAVALFAPALTGCARGGTEPETTGSAAPTVPTDAKEALLASTKEIAKGNFKFSMKGADLDGQGFVHQPSQSAQMSMKAGSGDFSMDMEVVYISPDSWVKLTVTGAEGVPGLEKLNTGKYQHLDQSKIKSTEGLGFNFTDVDPAGSEALTKAIVDVRKTGEGAYTGTIDLAKATDAGMVNEDSVTLLGAEATKLPFEAKLDTEGRLTSLAIQLPAVGSGQEQELTVGYSDYGAASPAKAPPAAEVVEASPELYELFNK